jgi:hypothetical protein
MELLLLFLSALVVPPLMKAYLRYLAPQGDRHHGFEQWCAGRPLLFAVHCPHVGADLALETLRGEVARRDGWANHGGGFPWQSYRVTFEAVKLSESVVGFRLTGCRVPRGRTKVTPLVVLLERVARVPAKVDELWLHGQLHHDDEHDDPEVSWRAHVDREDRLSLHAARELPYWLVQTFGKGPPRRRRDAKVSDLVTASDVG